VGKIVASYLMKVHLHEDDGASPDDPELELPTNDQVKDTVVAALREGTGLATTVSLVERTDD